MSRFVNCEHPTYARTIEYFYKLINEYNGIIKFLAEGRQQPDERERNRLRMKAAREAETPEHREERLRREHRNADIVAVPVRLPRRSEADRLNAQRQGSHELRIRRAFPSIELVGFNYDQTQDWALFVTSAHGICGKTTLERTRIKMVRGQGVLGNTQPRVRYDTAFARESSRGKREH